MLTLYPEKDQKIISPMKHKSSSIRYDKSWRFVFLVLCVLHFKNVNAQNIVPNFLVNNSLQCFSSNSFVFTNITQGNNVSYKWDFGDGSFDTTVNATKVYNHTGNFNVSLIATKNNISYYFSKQITVAAEPVISSISLQGTYSGKSYTFISSSTIASGNMNYLWDFGDTTFSTLINPTHTYQNDGTYNVVLNVVSDLGCSSIKNYAITITSSDTSVVEPKFTVNKSNQCVANNSFVFINQTNLSQVLNFYWEFGDGSISYLLNPSKTYSNAGTYIVKLNIQKAGITYTSEKRITVGSIVNAAFDVIQLSDSATNIFSNQTNGTGITTHYFWDFGDGCSSTLTNPQHLFFNGTYNVSLVAIDSLGCNSSISKTVTISSQTINNIASQFVVNKDTQCLANNNFIFTNLSSKACNISNKWDFGDGNFSTLFQPVKQFNKTGTYNVSLTVFAGTNSYTSTKSIVVKNEAIWTGIHSSNVFDSANWQCSYPTDSTDVVINAGALHNPILNDSTFIIRNLTIANGASFIINNSTLKLSGSLVNAGMFDAQTSTIEFNGESKQTISGSALIGNLIINNATGADIAGVAADSVSVYNVLTLKRGAFCTGNRIIFKSNAKGTARLNKIGVNGYTGTLCGNVTVERYFQNKRAWRFLTVPFTANGNNANYSIFNTWEKMTNVTGPAGIGFDYFSPYYSMTAWDEVNQKWSNIANTYTNYIINNNSNFSNTPYFIFVRGNKSINEAYISGETTFSTSGTLQTGNQTLNFSGRKNNDYIFVANPYASPVDLASLQSQGLSGNYYFYDATLNTNGAYVTVSNKGNGNWIITPAGSALKDKVIQSGQAMLVGVSSSSGYITFNENAKTNVGSNFTTFGTTTTTLNKLEINLYRINADSSKTLLDGAVTVFGDNFSKAVDDNDSKKVMNAKENIGFKNGNNILSIEARPFVIGEDSINIFTGDLYDSVQYAIEVKYISNDTIVKQLILSDSNLNSQTKSAVNKAMWYYFNTINATNNAVRFSIVVKGNIAASPANTDFFKLNAKQVGDKISVSWKVENENNMQSYTVQHSTNNKDFKDVNIVKAINGNQTNNYAIDDNIVRVKGINYYRILSTNKNDASVASKSVAVNFIVADKRDLIVYPNPTKERIKVELNSLVDQDLQINFTNSATGKMVKSVFIKAKIGTNKYALNLADSELSLGNGLYAITILGDNVNYPSQKVMLMKGE